MRCTAVFSTTFAQVVLIAADPRPVRAILIIYYVYYTSIASRYYIIIWYVYNRYYNNIYKHVCGAYVPRARA